MKNEIKKVKIACPKCGTKLKVPKIGVQANGNCPLCKEELLVEFDDFNIGTLLLDNGALICSIIAFAFGVVMMINFPFLGIGFYVPMFFASFVLSIVCIAKGLAGSGMIMMILSIIVPTFLFMFLMLAKINNF